MKLLTTFISIVVFVLFLSGVAFYFTREYFLYRGVENFKKSVLVVKRNASASTACADKAPDLLGVIDSDTQPVTQLRFISSTEYVAEVLCPGYSFDPNTISQQSLDDYMTKLPGSSGLLLGTERTGVELAVFQQLQKEINTTLGTNFTFIQKNRSVVMEGGSFVTSLPDEDLGVGPIASCQGFGYQCCQSDSQVGVGDPLLGAVGCEQSCYSSCIQRPVVLSMNTNPFFDVKTRTLNIRSGESVDFAYVLDTGASETVQVIMDYGDGMSENSTEKTATLSHVYNCAADACEYQATLIATDAFGTQSAITPISQLQIRVSGAGL